VSHWVAVRKLHNGTLHDVGKITIGSEILSKPGKREANESLRRLGEPIRSSSQDGKEIHETAKQPRPEVSHPAAAALRATLNPCTTGLEEIMANLTITVPEEILKSARRRALEQGTSVNALLRDYLRQFTGAQPTQAKAAERVLELSKKARAGRGNAKWTREDLHRR